MSTAAWAGRRVLLTGHTGFKGSWLALWLQHLGAEVTGLALEPNTQPAMFEAARVAEGMTSIIGDVRDAEAVASAYHRAEPEVVLHLAAQPLVRASYADPAGTYATNVVGTANVLEAVRRGGATQVVVNVTTDKCYENQEWEWGYREVDRLGGHDPYSSSKACAELVTDAYRRSFFSGPDEPAVASARAGNVIGGGDWSDERLVPDAVRAWGSGSQVRLRHPSSTRPWQHVLEPLAGYLLLAERLMSEGKDFAEAWNFGPTEDDVAVSAVIEAMAERWPGASWVGDPGPHPHEAGRLRLDCSKARSRLSWAPRLDLATALDWVVEWYLLHLRGADMRNATLEQIERYGAMRATP